MGRIKSAYFKTRSNIYQPRLAASSKVFASSINPLVTAKRSLVFDAIRIVSPSPLKCSLIHTAITLRLLSEVADRNARLLAISFSREILKRWVEFTLETKMFSFGRSGTSLSFRRWLMLSRNCCWVVSHPCNGGSIQNTVAKRGRYPNLGGLFSKQ